MKTSLDIIASVKAQRAAQGFRIVANVPGRATLYTAYMRNEAEQADLVRRLKLHGATILEPSALA